MMFTDVHLLNSNHNAFIRISISKDTGNIPSVKTMSWLFLCEMPVKELFNYSTAFLYLELLQH